MKFKIDPKIFEKFEGFNLGLIIAKGVNNKGITEDVQSKIREQEKEIKVKYNIETLPQVPKIDAWKKAYAIFGGEPKKNRSSIENLYKLVLNGIELRQINKLVDCYNFISLKYTLPAGGEDINKMKGDIVLTFAGASEAPVLLLGEKEAHSPHNGEVIYKDDISAICRRWNWREADRTKLTEETKNCVLVIEGLPPVTKKDVEAAIKELKDMVQKHCGGKIDYAILDKSKTEVVLR